MPRQGELNPDNVAKALGAKVETEFEQGKNLAAKGSGTYTFDEATGVYTVTYTADTRAVSTTFTYADNAITFTSPMAFGMAVLPFLPGDILKALVAAFLGVKLNHALKNH